MQPPQKIFYSFEINIKNAMADDQIQKGDTELIAFQFFGSLCSSAIYESIHIEKISLDNIIDSTIKFTLMGIGIDTNNITY